MHTCSYILSERWACPPLLTFNCSAPLRRALGKQVHSDGVNRQTDIYFSTGGSPPFIPDEGTDTHFIKQQRLQHLNTRDIIVKIRPRPRHFGAQRLYRRTRILHRINQYLLSLSNVSNPDPCPYARADRAIASGSGTRLRGSARFGALLVHAQPRRPLQLAGISRSCEVLGPKTADVVCSKCKGVETPAICPSFPIHLG